MKNLENYGVLEMDAMEIREIEGGGKIARLFGYTIGYIDAMGQKFSQWVNDQAV